MRVVLVGNRAARDELRRLATAKGLVIAGEAETVAEARTMHSAEALLVTAAAETRSIVEPLTPRELDVLQLLSEGLPNKAIAARLGISDQTVKFHVAAIYGKLGAANRADAVRIAIQQGLVLL